MLERCDYCCWMLLSEFESHERLGQGWGGLLLVDAH